jgi:C1A family cysteine protease
LPATSVESIKAELASGRCVAFAIPVFNSWFQNLEVRRTGDIVMPVPGEVRSPLGHAMCIVGYQDLADEPEIGGRFILRNSWNEQWAIRSPYEPGYGTIPYTYIARFCVEAYVLG